jgi:hypothetical protein
VPDGAHLALVLGCDQQQQQQQATGGCSNASVTVTVLDGDTMQPLGSPSKALTPPAGSFSAAVDVQWSASSVSGLGQQGRRVALQFALRGPIELYSFTYSATPVQ